jgi:hypothetical protein
MTVKELRNSGFTVKVRHNRNYDQVIKLGGVIKQVSPLGGFTEVNVYQDGELQCSGVARCRTDENYNRKFGLRVALGRALNGVGVLA